MKQLNHKLNQVKAENCLDATSGLTIRPKKQEYFTACGVLPGVNWVSLEELCPLLSPLALASSYTDSIINNNYNNNNYNEQIFHARWRQASGALPVYFLILLLSVCLFVCLCRPHIMHTGRETTIIVLGKQGNSDENRLDTGTLY